MENSAFFSCIILACSSRRINTLSVDVPRLLFYNSEGGCGNTSLDKARNLIISPAEHTSPGEREKK